jgi:hypothetical protein
VTLGPGMSSTQNNLLLASVIPLAKACPVDSASPEECPLHALRSLKPARQKQWFAALNADETAYLAAYCHVCAVGKLSGKSDECRQETNQG